MHDYESRGARSEGTTQNTPLNIDYSNTNMGANIIGGGAILGDNIEKIYNPSQAIPVAYAVNNQNTQTPQPIKQEGQIAYYTPGTGELITVPTRTQYIQQRNLSQSGAMPYFVISIVLLGTCGIVYYVRKKRNERNANLAF